jgi:hypothetical protein
MPAGIERRALSFERFAIDAHINVVDAVTGSVCVRCLLPRRARNGTRLFGGSWLSFTYHLLLQATFLLGVLLGAAESACVCVAATEVR